MTPLYLTVKWIWWHLPARDQNQLVCQDLRGIHTHLARNCLCASAACRTYSHWTKAQWKKKKYFPLGMWKLDNFCVFFLSYVLPSSCSYTLQGFLHVTEVLHALSHNCTCVVSSPLVASDPLCPLEITDWFLTHWNQMPKSCRLQWRQCFFPLVSEIVKQKPFDFRYWLCHHSE